jgi:hypothetical protein
MNTTQQASEHIHYVTWWQCQCKAKSFEQFHHDGKGHHMVKHTVPDTSLTYVGTWMMERLTKNGVR